MAAPGLPSGDASPPGKVLGPEFFDRDPLEVAPDLLGTVLVRDVGGKKRWGRIVEVEAYKGPEDLAAHSSRGRTPRTEVMFGPPGRAYVYFVYGMHHCLNFVCRPVGVPQAILVRALEPGGDLPKASGPGLVCRALCIDRSLNGAPLEPPDLYVLDDGFRAGPVLTGARVGVAYSGEWAGRPWRFFLDSPYVSNPRPRLLSRRSR